MKHRSRLAPLSVRPRSSGPPRRGGAAFKPPRFEVNRQISEMCSSFWLAENRRKISLPGASVWSTGLALKDDKTSHDIETTLVRKGKTTAAAPVW